MKLVAHTYTDSSTKLTRASYQVYSFVGFKELFLEPLGHAAYGENKAKISETTVEV